MSNQQIDYRIRLQDDFLEVRKHLDKALKKLNTIEYPANMSKQDIKALKVSYEMLSTIYFDTIVIDENYFKETINKK